MLEVILDLVLDDFFLVTMGSSVSRETCTSETVTDLLISKIDSTRLLKDVKIGPLFNLC